MPGLISDLRSADGEVRSAALYELYGNIFHQGSRYEASAYAVPFLLELVAERTTPARQEVIRLLADLAVGHRNYHLATGFPVTELWNAMTEVPKETRQRWSQAMKDWYDVVGTGQRQPVPLDKAERPRRRRWCPLGRSAAGRAASGPPPRPGAARRAGRWRRLAGG